MKFVILTSIMFLSACSNHLDTSSIELARLTRENIELKRENANLKEEIIFLKAGGDPNTITTTTSTEPFANISD
jgi:hypothetical protein